MSVCKFYSLISPHSAKSENPFKTAGQTTLQLLICVLVCSHLFGVFFLGFCFPFALPFPPWPFFSLYLAFLFILCPLFHMFLECGENADLSACCTGQRWCESGCCLVSWRGECQKALYAIASTCLLPNKLVQK